MEKTQKCNICNKRVNDMTNHLKTSKKCANKSKEINAIKNDKNNDEYDIINNRLKKKEKELDELIELYKERIRSLGLTHLIQNLIPNDKADDYLSSSDDSGFYSDDEKPNRNEENSRNKAPPLPSTNPEVLIRREYAVMKK